MAADELLGETTAIPCNVNGVVYRLEPPTTGSQKCDSCFGWIVGALSYIDEGKRFCPVCWFFHLKEAGRDGSS